MSDLPQKGDVVLTCAHPSKFSHWYRLPIFLRTPDGLEAADPYVELCEACNAEMESVDWKGREEETVPFIMERVAAHYIFDGEQPEWKETGEDAERMADLRIEELRRKH